MDYYHAPLACSLAGHVLIREAGLPVRRVPVSLASGRCADGLALQEINPKGLVPVLRLDDGTLLTESAAVLSVLADLAPERGYLPPRDTAEGRATLEWLSFTATELHKLCLYPAFQAGAPDAVKAWCRAQLPGRMAVAEARLRDHPWLAGEHFTIADAYFGWALATCRYAGFDIGASPVLKQAWKRFMARPAFAEALAEEQAMYAQAA